VYEVTKIIGENKWFYGWMQYKVIQKKFFLQNIFLWRELNGIKLRRCYSVTGNTRLSLTSKCPFPVKQVVSWLQLLCLKTLWLLYVLQNLMMIKAPHIACTENLPLCIIMKINDEQFHKNQ